MISIAVIPPDYSSQLQTLLIASSADHRFVKSISHWSAGVSQSLKFDAPLVAVVKGENLQPANIVSPDQAEDTEGSVDEKGAGSIKGQAALEEALRYRQDCLAPDEIAPKAAFPNVFEVQVKGNTIAQMPTQAQADEFSQRIQTMLQRSDFDPDALVATLVEGRPAGKFKEDILFRIDSELAAQFDRNPELLAIAWINHLRKALDAPALDLAEAQVTMLSLLPTNKRLKGNASWYDPAFTGSPTATGEAFDPIDLTAAHPTLPFGTYLKVTNEKTQDSVIVRINDRGPYLEDRSLDVSGEAARCLNSAAEGVVPFQAIVMINPASPPSEPISNADGSTSPEALSQP